MIREWLQRRRYLREHRWTHAHLSAYLEQELNAAERRRVEAHTSICPNCTRVLQTLRRMLDGLAMLRAPPQTGVAESVTERFRDES